MKYKKGDMVRVVRDGSNNGHENKVGGVYRILEVVKGAPPYMLQRGGPFYCEDDDLELAWNFNDYLNQIK